MKLKDVFKPELDQINNKEFKTHIIKILDTCPNYIIRCPSSSTGKCHPTDETGENAHMGMIWHIKRVAVFADEIARMEQHTPIERDVLIAGSILHDLYKQGMSTGAIDTFGLDIHKEKHTIKEHPILIYNRIIEYANKWDEQNGEIAQTTPIGVKEIKDFLPYTYWSLIVLAGVCLFHEGQWTIPQSKEVFLKTGIRMDTGWKVLCRSMHMADYFASRRSVYDIMQKMTI